MLQIRRFVHDSDDSIWVDVLNASHRDDEDWRTITVDELRSEEKHPGFDFEGRFIAELEGRPVGLVHAFVDRFRTDGQGAIRVSLIPGGRGGCVADQLVETGLEELKACGMSTAQTWTPSAERDRILLFERFGFERVRVSSQMEMDLAALPRDIAPSTQMTIRPLRLHVEDDIILFDWLGNESFREHFNFRPLTVEETRSHLLNAPSLKQRDFFLATVDGRDVGYVVVTIDEKYNLEKNTKTGEVTVIGVLKPYRRAGVGTVLILHALQTLKDKGMTGAVLRVDDDNPTKAMALYEKVGFRVNKEYFIHRRSL